MYNVNDIITGTISGIKQYGMFIKFDDTFGFCHISNISKNFVSDISSIYKFGQTIKAKIIEIDENNRINLSIKELETEVIQKPSKITSNEIKNKNNINNNKHKKQSFDDLVNDFLKVSNEKLTSINNRNKKHNKR